MNRKLDIVVPPAVESRFDADYRERARTGTADRHGQPGWSALGMGSRRDQDQDLPATGDETRIDDHAFGVEAAAFDDPELRRKFQPLELIGVGGMGAVYKVRHRHLNHVRAVKLLNAGATRVRVERLRREAAIGTELSHPALAAVYDLEELPGGRLAIVMEYLEGRDLRRRIEQDGPLDPREIPALFDGVADALDRMHERGVIHRDIKPANLFQCEDGSLRILDFGVSRQLEDGGRLTRTGGFVGTPAFMAPEQFGGEEADARSDVYSLGASIYFCVTGQLPFQATTEAELVAGILYGVRPRADAVRPGLPRHASMALARAMHLEPGQRFESAGALLKALAEELPLGDDEPTADGEAGPVPLAAPQVVAAVEQPTRLARALRAIRWAAAALIVVGTAVAAWQTWLQPPLPGEESGSRGRDEPVVAAAHLGGTLRIGTTRKVLTLDPLATMIDEFRGIFPLLYDTLVEVDWTGEVQPSLAERWEVDDERRRYVFHLRPGVVLHAGPEAPDGAKLRAEDVRRSLQRVFDWIAADEHSPWQLVPPAETVRALDERTVEVVFTRPAPSFCHALAWPEWSVIATSALESAAEGEPDFAPVGTGPFRVRESSRSRVVLERHPRTWHRDALDRALPYPEQVVIQPFRDPYLARTALLEGRIDLIVQVPRDVIDEVVDYEDRRVRMVEGWEDYQAGAYLDDSVREQHQLLVDRRSPGAIGGDARVRRAIDAAIPRDALATRSTVPATGPLGEGMLGFEPRRDERGSRRAAELLAAAGYPGGEGLPPVSVCGVESQEQELETIAAAFGDIGLQTEVRVVEYETWMQYLERGGCDLLNAHYSAMVIDDDPSDAILGLIAVAALPERDTRVAPLAEELRRTADRGRRGQILVQLSDAMTEDAVVLFVTHRRPAWPHFSYLAGPRVGGLVDPDTGYMNPVRQRMRELWVRPEEP